MKNVFKLLLITTLVSLLSCKKENQPVITPSSSAVSYSSITDFFNKNGLQIQTYNINASTGGSFTTPQGTKVIIPPGSFVTQSGGAVTGNVKIEFKDIYKKSDMLLSDVGTQTLSGPLKSGGEFFIKASQNNSGLSMLWGKSIKVLQPAALTGTAIDSAMGPFVQQDSSAGNNWAPASPALSALMDTANSYMFTLYQFSSNPDSGSWCNSDNSSFFSSYTQTTLTLRQTDNFSQYHTQVFLVFRNINSMIHVYHGSNYSGPQANDFPYSYAPLGLQCTVVAVGVKDGSLYSSFTPITISANLVVNFSMSAITSTEFVNKVKALD
ncbi:MAG: hypothetical protein ACXVC6_09250 [Bacteroidia bacterium]